MLDPHLLYRWKILYTPPLKVNDQIDAYHYLASVICYSYDSRVYLLNDILRINDEMFTLKRRLDLLMDENTDV